ncbi:hypothetical protein [Streptomyces decoyicus]
MLWLDEQAQQNPSHHVNVTRFIQEQQLHGEDAAVLAFELEQRDLVEVSRNWGGEAPDVHLTDAGRAAIHRLKKLRLDRAARLRYTMDAFHRWLFDTAGDQKPINPALFLAAPDAFFAGSAMSDENLHEALSYLAEHKLIERIDTDPATVAITPQGIRCVLAGGSVQDHINQPRPGSTYNNYLPNAKGVIIGEQQHRHPGRPCPRRHRTSCATWPTASPRSSAALPVSTRPTAEQQASCRPLQARTRHQHGTNDQHGHALHEVPPRCESWMLRQDGGTACPDGQVGRCAAGPASSRWRHGAGRHLAGTLLLLLSLLGLGDAELNAVQFQPKVGRR